MNESNNKTIVIVNTGTANVGSLRASLERIASSVVLSSSPSDFLSADYLCVPGVSSFGSTAAGLSALHPDLPDLLRARIAQGRHTLLVCVGLQLLALSSAESPGAVGLGVLPCAVERLSGPVRVPQQAWNLVSPAPGASAGLLGRTGYAYFSNSYCLRAAPVGWDAATTRHGVEFVAALCKDEGRVLATQFHPELSGAFGRDLLSRWLNLPLYSSNLTSSSSISSSIPSSIPSSISSSSSSLSSGQTHRIIPCLDVRDGRVVKGVQFSGIVDAGDPVTQAAQYEAFGADELVMLDISATPDGRKTHAELVTRLSAALSIPLTVGGGIKTVDDAVRLLNAGADKVSLNTAAVRDPQLIAALAEKFGRQCVVLAIDASQRAPGEWEVVVACGRERTGMDVVAWARQGVALGAGEILLTSFDRDGTKAGYDCALLSAVAAAVEVPVVASGGASGYAHMVEAFKAGADAVLAASIFHYNETTCDTLKAEIIRHGIPMRLDAIPSSSSSSLNSTSSLNSNSTSASSSSLNFPRGAQCVVPSIDVLDGHVVQLVGGNPDDKKVDAGSDAISLAKRFALAGEIAVVDLNAALGKGDNTEFIKTLLSVAPCRVGGGIRSLETARMWLDAGACKIVVGTAATPEFLQQLPRERVVAALDALQGEVVVHGWQTRTGLSVVDQVRRLRPFVAGFLVTFVEREGRMVGVDLPAIREIAQAVYGGDPSLPPCTLTIAGGITTAEDLAALDALGAEGQVGMALYTDKLDLGRAIAAPLVSDRADGLFPTVVVAETGASLGLVYSSAESVAEAVRQRAGVYWSRSRGALWVKGETSGDRQELLRIEMDCDRDALRFVVRQGGSGFCHRPSFAGCFGNGRVERPIDALVATLQARKGDAPEGSYTARLFSDHALLAAKLQEEAAELAEAEDPQHVAAEAADLIYFALVAAVKAGATLQDVEKILHARSLKVQRRPGDAKPQYLKSTSSPSSTTLTTSTTSSTSSSIEDVPLLKLKESQEVMGLSPDPVDDVARKVALEIVQDVRTKGLPGLLFHAQRLGDIPSLDSPWILRPPELKAAFDAQTPEVQAMLLRVAERIRRFAQAQKDSLAQTIRVDMQGEGNAAGQSVAPMDTAGCYAPGGRYPLPSSVLMTAVPARVAGCQRVVAASPRPAPITLAAAHVAGVDMLITVGGAQAIAALAYGVRDGEREMVPPCDVVVGPGNRFVTAAKQLVSGIVAIDMLAGPSECLVLADAHADPAVVASDLIAQAEHDVAAVPILVALEDRGIVARVEAEIARQLAADLPTAQTATESFKRNGYAVVVPDVDAAVKLCDVIAPEHLEIHTQDPSAIVPRLKHYGALFIGATSAEVLGDYGFGPNHTLPTGGTARSFGGLSVFTFLRVRTWINIEKLETCQESIQDAVELAKLEGLFGHSRSASKRLLVDK